jgi:hypothetical protein
MSTIVDELVFGAVIVGVLGAAGYGAYHLGRTTAQHEAEQARQAVNIAASDRFIKAQREARAREIVLQQSLAERDRTLDTQRATHANDLDILRASVRAGAVRLRVPVARCEVPATGRADVPAVAAAPGSEARADLMPGVADAVFRLAGQSANDVRDYNEVTERYEQCRTFLTLH